MEDIIKSKYHGKRKYCENHLQEVYDKAKNVPKDFGDALGISSSGAMWLVRSYNLKNTHGYSSLKDKYFFELEHFKSVFHACNRYTPDIAKVLGTSGSNVRNWAEKFNLELKNTRVEIKCLTCGSRINRKDCLVCTTEGRLGVIDRVPARRIRKAIEAQPDVFNVLS